MTNCTSGRERRLSRLLGEGRRLVFAPLDDSLLAGPELGLSDLRTKARQIVKGNPDAIIGFSGLLKRCGNDLGSVPFILNLTASTTRGMHTRKTLVHNVEDAVQLGADAVAVHVNLSSSFETEMLHNLGEVSRSCERFGMPLLCISYPRQEGEHGDNNYLGLLAEQPDEYAAMVRHCVRVGVELGADMIKTQYTGSVASFRTVVEASCGVPIISAGGPAIAAAASLRMASEIVLAGAAGVSFGRNVYNRSDSELMIRLLRIVLSHPETVENICVTHGVEKAEGLKILAGKG